MKKSRLFLIIFANIIASGLLNPSNAATLLTSSGGMWDTDTLTPIGSFGEGQLHRFSHIAAGANGYIYATDMSDGLLKIDSVTGNIVGVLSRSVSDAGLAISDDGLLYARNTANKIAVYDLSTDQPIDLWDFGYQGELVFGPDGMLYTANPGGISILDPDTKSQVGSIPISGIAAPSMISTLAFSPDGDLYVTSSDGRIHAWDVSTGNLILIGPRINTEGGMVFGPDGYLYVNTTTTMPAYEIWDPITRTSIAGFGSGGNAISLEFLPQIIPIPPAIDIEKLTNGNQADGANDSDVPRIAAGDIVTWTYLVTNTGEVEVSEAEVVVTDDQLEFTPNGPTNDDGDTILSPGETWFYTATAQVLDLSTPPAGVTVVPGCDDGRNVYQNTGRVEVSATEVFDEDLSHYCNFGVADVDIRKQAEGPDTRTFTSGSDVPFEIVATNTGDEDLSNVAVNDPEVSDCDRNIGALAAGASVRYTCIASSVTITFDNEACVTGERNGVTVEDCDPSTVEILAANNPPDCSHAVASLDTLWPPNHKFVSVNVLGVTDLDGDPVTITIDSIFQDEPVDTGGGRFVPDGQGVGTDAALVRAERSGTRRVPGNGRVYHIGFTAEDDKGEACSAEVLVGAPHDRNTAPVDNGAIYDSTVP